MASGDTLAVFFPAMSEPPPVAYPTFDVRNGVLVLDYDDSTDETCDFPGFMPRHYDGGGVTVTIGFAATSATTGLVSIICKFARIGDDTDDIDDSLFAALNNISVAPASVSGEIKYATMTFADGAAMDSVVAGDYFRFKVNRDGNGSTGTDTMVGDMELVFVELKET